MDTITLGAVAIAIPAALAPVVAACPELTDFLAVQVAAGETRKLDATLDGAAIGGERTASELDVSIELGGGFSIDLHAEELEGDEVSFTLAYMGHDGAVVNRIEEACRADGKVGDLASPPAGMASLSGLELGFFDEEYDREDRRFRVTIDLEAQAPAVRMAA